jgi:hypothetical protein
MITDIEVIEPTPVIVAMDITLPGATTVEVGVGAAAALMDMEVSFPDEPVTNIVVNYPVATALDVAFGGVIADEVPGGAINGLNTMFTTHYAYKLLWVYLNGLRLHEGGDYTETSDTAFQLIEPPLTGDRLTVDYYIED